MSGFFNRLVKRQPNSARKAKDRLQLVLVHDRTNISPSSLDLLRDDLIETISRHVDVEPSAVRIRMSRDGREQRLIADIPIRSGRSRRFL